VDNHFFACPIEEREFDVCEFVVRLPLVHLLLDAATAFDSVSDVLFEFLVGGGVGRIKSPL